MHERGGALAVHLMVERPERFVDDYARAGADAFTVHVEATVHLHRTLQLVREAGMVPGVTLNPATPVALLVEAAREADNLLCMSVNPGWGGQSLHPGVARAACGAAARWPGPARASRSTAASGPTPSPTAVRAGANRLTAGSAIYAAPEPGRRVPATSSSASAPRDRPARR